MSTRRNGAPAEPSETEDLISELAQSTPEAVKKMRSHTRLSIRVNVTVVPGSLSHRDGTLIQGITGDVSAGGTQVLLPRPLGIGDVYLVSFDRKTLDIPDVFALCLRGRQVRPDAYEAGLRFLEPVTLPNPEAPGKSASLI